MKTIRSTDEAKHIAEQSGLTFSYNRSARRYELAARHHVAGMLKLSYTKETLLDTATDRFYDHCAHVATMTATPDQMHKVFMRAKHAELFDMLEREGREKFTDDERAQWLELNPTSHDKQVHAIEDAIYQMRLDAEEIGGTYADHKAKFAGVRAVASYGKGKHIGYSVDGRFVMSLPAQLNNCRIPCPEECDDILNGESITDSDGWRNRAHDLAALARSIVADTVLCWPGAKVGAALTVTGDGTPAGVRYVMWCGKRTHTLAALQTSPLRLYTHWRGFLENCAAALVEPEAPRVDLSKPAAAPHVASVLELPQEPNLSVLERVAASLRARRLSTVPATVAHDYDEPGNPCDGCGACLHAGQTMCDDCRQNAPEVRSVYQCPICEHEWTGAYSETARDDCPNCGALNVEPCDTEQVTA